MKRKLNEHIVKGITAQGKNWNIEELADYLIANGVILPPVKVGQIVYSYSDTFGIVLGYFVENLTIGYLEDNRNCYTYEANCCSDSEFIDCIDFEPDDIGKTVFLSKEEAEKALRGE